MQGLGFKIFKLFLIENFRKISNFKNFNIKNKISIIHPTGAGSNVCSLLECFPSNPTQSAPAHPDSPLPARVDAGFDFLTRRQAAARFGRS